MTPSLLSIVSCSVKWSRVLVVFQVHWGIMGLLRVSVIFLLSLITMTLAEPPGCKIRITDRGLEMCRISIFRLNMQLSFSSLYKSQTGLCLTCLQWRPRQRSSWKKSWVTSACQRCAVKRAASSTPSKSKFTSSTVMQSCSTHCVLKHQQADNTQNLIGRRVRWCSVEETNI